MDTAYTSFFSGTAFDWQVGIVLIATIYFTYMYGKQAGLTASIANTGGTVAKELKRAQPSKPLTQMKTPPTLPPTNESVTVSKMVATKHERKQQQQQQPTRSTKSVLDRAVTDTVDTDTISCKRLIFNENPTADISDTIDLAYTYHPFRTQTTKRTVTLGQSSSQAFLLLVENSGAAEIDIVGPVGARDASSGSIVLTRGVVLQPGTMGMFSWSVKGYWTSLMSGCQYISG